ncbi:MAG: hypothetical protein KBE40_08920 [Bacteroidales bacterium]|nr:hypothetical protein [Bacteroidales bacterium]
MILAKFIPIEIKMGCKDNYIPCISKGQALRVCCKKNLPFPLHSKEYFFRRSLDKRTSFRWLKSIPFSFFFFSFFSFLGGKMLLSAVAFFSCAAAVEVANN